MRLRFGVLLALTAGMIAAVTVPAAPAAGHARSAGNPAEGVPAVGHVFLIIGENTTYFHPKPAPPPFPLRTIPPHAARLSNYYPAPPRSPAHYVAPVTG